MKIKQFIFFLLTTFLWSFNPVKENIHYNDFKVQKSVVPKSHDENEKTRVRKNNNLKIASWNIRDLGRSKSTEELYQIANILRDFDIVAIQEVVAKDPAGAQAVAKIADELNRMGSKWDYQISNPTKSPSVYISERYAFLWKTAKVGLVQKAYLDKQLETYCFREPFVGSFKSKSSSEPFYVINYHARKYFDKPEEELVHFINYKERLNSNKVLIAGDFNLDENHNVWKPFYAKGFKSALKNQQTTLKIKCKNNSYLNHAIDNIYFASGIEKVGAGSIDLVKTCGNLLKARKISDHLPIYMEFNLEKVN